MLDFWEEYDISRDELLKRRAAENPAVFGRPRKALSLGRREEIWELLVKRDRMEGFPQIARYRRVLERVVTDDDGGKPVDVLVYVR